MPIVLSLNKIIPFMLLFFFISGTFATSFDSVSVSELVEDSWVSKAPMSQARAGLGVVAVDGKIYAIGGSTTYAYDYFNGGEFVGTNECYNPATDTWVTLADMPTPRANFAIAAYQGKIYCMGGLICTGMDEWGTFAEVVSCNTIEVYDTITGSWNTMASLPYASYNSAAINNASLTQVSYYLSASVVDGKIFVIRGSELVMYDPEADIWSNKASMPISGFHQESAPVSVVVDGMIVVVSDIVNLRFVSLGLDWAPTAGSVYYDPRGVFVYDSVRDVWHEGENRGRIVHLGGAGTTTGVYAQKKIYVMGRALDDDSNYVYGVNRVYDVAGDFWSDGTDMLTPRVGFGVAVVDDVLYVVGGKTEQKVVSALNEVYVPIGYSSVPISALSRLFFKFSIVAVLVLIVGTVTVVLVLYSKRREVNKKNEPQSYN